MYTFLKPKYEIYPYSQHDIPPTSEYQQRQHHLHYLRHYPQPLIESDPNYYQKSVSPHTSVEIQPSNSYEIKQTDNGYKTIFTGSDEHSDYGGHDHGASHDHSAGEEHSGEPVPVIVLRVPGPAKYATHLQALLQQYLEVRASQYIHALQEQEAHGVDSSQQISDHGHDMSAFSSLPILPYGQHQAYLPAQMYINPIQQIHPYFAAQAIHNPYAHAHIAQPVSIEDDHSAASPESASYYKAHSQPDEETDIHAGKIDRFRTNSNRNSKYSISSEQLKSDQNLVQQKLRKSFSMKFYEPISRSLFQLTRLLDFYVFEFLYFSCDFMREKCI